MTAVGRWAALFTAGAVIWATAACSGSADHSATSRPTTAAPDVTAVATDAYVFGFPLVLMDATRATGAPANHFAHARTLPDASNRTVVRLNQDTLYSQAWLDLSAEPMVLQVPAMPDNRFWMMPALDAWTNVTHNPSSVRPQVAGGAATGPFTYLFTGPNWHGTVPDGMTPLPMPTDLAWILGRIEVHGQDDLPAVHTLQDQLQLAPLSAWQQHPGVGNPAGDAAATGDPGKTVADMDGRTFFDTLSRLMTANPPAADDAAVVGRFATIGITPGGTVDNQPAEQLDAAVTAAKARIHDFRNPSYRDQNGWQFSTDGGQYGTRYDERANVALIGLGANLAEDALYPTMFDIPADADADGAGPRYRIHFPAGALPPVDAFWSITAYDAENFLVDNPAKIYSVGHQIPPTLNPDGSLDLVVQRAQPGADVGPGNWLPIPESGKFSLTLRMYAPRPEALNGSWQPPALTPA